jgi:hypothetical protein
MKGFTVFQIEVQMDGEIIYDRLYDDKLSANDDYDSKLKEYNNELLISGKKMNCNIRKSRFDPDRLHISKCGDHFVRMMARTVLTETK